ncbi:DUF5691 domain-containing protein [Methylobacterium sp. E-045]|uniref:DUF5691 domain-containing protein n=1 Tax=Methylobacterium sp. E-045 TaxID=2836575 RepID=UPI001FBC0305|nr:DUF5691 domain-containing protein [Methylobacterium sp. E-045]MCJ2130969.1 DUF5691 domain-containing protein [Methylobacterium sp. E-045]
MSLGTSTPDDWEAALVAALLGADRSPAPAEFETVAGALPREEPGMALLTRVAVAGIHHLAGSGFPPDAFTPAPPCQAKGRPCPPDAAARLGLLLAAGTEARGRVKEWCEIAAERGMRAPPWLLPALAPYRREWDETIDAVAGEELDWLETACSARGTEAAAPAPDDAEASPAERYAAFAAFRRRDPEGARAELEAGFRAEKAEMRERLVHILEIGLSEADAPFLETCLDDRAGGVRAAARSLLPRLTRSLLAFRMAARVRTALVIESRRTLLGGTKHGLVVTLLEESPTLARDGIEPNAYERRRGGVRASLLESIVAAAPLHAFAEHPPRLWIELALRSEWPNQIVDGLLTAARRERDLDWVRTMATVLAEAIAGRLSGIKPGDDIHEIWARAVRSLPDAEWEATVTRHFGGGEIDTILTLLRQTPSSLSGAFTAALLDWLASVTRTSPSDRKDLASAYLLTRLAERAWPADDHAASAAAILARLPDEAEDNLRRQIEAFAETLALRATIRREFA